MRYILWKRWKLCVPCLLAFGVLVVMMALGCSQSPEEGGGDQTSEGHTAATQGGTTAQATTQEETTTGQKSTTGEETTSSQENAAQQQNDSQQDQGDGQIETTTQGQQGQQNQQQGQQPQQTITVRVTGTEGLPFSGRVGSAQGLRRVEGSVPEKYEISFGGAAVTAAIRKQEPGRGTLRAEVIRGREVVASRESSSRTGVLNVVWTPQRQGNEGG